jgi:aryl-alcohol dehydrogenase-like predicted oxidoreductase
MDRFVTAGGNFFDTADVYGLGQSERVLGNWLTRQAKRDAFVIATKARIRTDMHDVNAGTMQKYHCLLFYQFINIHIYIYIMGGVSELF